MNEFFVEELLLAVLVFLAIAAVMLATRTSNPFPSAAGCRSRIPFCTQISMCAASRTAARFEISRNLR